MDKMHVTEQWVTKQQTLINKQKWQICFVEFNKNKVWIFGWQIVYRGKCSIE